MHVFGVFVVVAAVVVFSGIFVVDVVVIVAVFVVVVDVFVVVIFGNFVVNNVGVVVFVFIVVVDIVVAFFKFCWPKSKLCGPNPSKTAQILTGHLGQKKGRQKDGQTDEQVPPVFYRTSSPLGPLPCSPLT